MVEPKFKKWSYFSVFVLPCVILYFTFFIIPFFKGVGISLTNWDGLTPKTPIILEKTQFETEILSKLKNQKDKDFINEIYFFDTADNSYHRRAVTGGTKHKLERIFKKAKYEPERNRFVGLENYKRIFSGQISKNFYPYKLTVEKFTKTSGLPAFIGKLDFEREVLQGAKKNPEFEQLLKKAYQFDFKLEKYKLSKEYDEYLITDILWMLPEVDKTKVVSESELDDYIKNIKRCSIEKDWQSMNVLAAVFGNDNQLCEASKQSLLSVNKKMLDVADVKNALSESWVVVQNYMGVVGFTLFFAFFSVIGINIVAFALALALDTGIKGQKIFRTLFFLPNVLSMIIVALIWSMLFVQLLPAITGIDKWISDSRKTPWLTVLVAIWQGSGYYMIVYLAGLQNIPNEIIEAARIDGTTGFQRFKYITIPMMIPSITISLFLSIANAFKSFDLIYALLGPTGYATGTVPIVMDIYFDAFAYKESGLATAKAMVLFLVIAIITGIQLVTMKKKEVEA